MKSAVRCVTTVKTAAGKVPVVVGSNACGQKPRAIRKPRRAPPRSSSNIMVMRMPAEAVNRRFL